MSHSKNAQNKLKKKKKWGGVRIYIDGGAFKICFYR